MVFTSMVRFIRSRGPDEFWRKRKVFKLASHFIGRRRNCYSVAIRYVHRALVYATKGRKLKKEDMANLWETRLRAACNEHDIAYDTFKEGLSRSNILLNRKVLSDLAAWEPNTFKALTDIANERAKNDGLNGLKRETTVEPRVVTRGMFK
ncbi:mitochondrial ribosomal protein L20 [Carabus blaptoides fortunei]